MNSKIAEMLDNIANTLQAKGHVKEAEEIDIISNTIEASVPPSTMGVGEISPSTATRNIPEATPQDAAKKELEELANKYSNRPSFYKEFMQALTQGAMGSFPRSEGSAE